MFVCGVNLKLYFLPGHVKFDFIDIFERPLGIGKLGQRWVLEIIKTKRGMSSVIPTCEFMAISAFRYYLQPTK